jgi:hypothetical protein
MTMRKRFVLSASAATLAIAAGCATGPAFKAPEPAPADRAQLYIYRPMVLAGGGTVHKVTVDGKADTLSLPNASWQRVVLAPGVHTVAIKDYFGAMPCAPQPLVVTLEAGSTAYVANVVKTTQGIGTLFIGCTTERRASDSALKDLVGLSGAQ